MVIKDNFEKASVRDITRIFAGQPQDTPGLLAFDLGEFQKSRRGTGQPA